MKQKIDITNSEKEKLFVEKRLNKENLRWARWRLECYSKGIPDISKENSNLILQYLKDMEMGLNVSVLNSKGARSPRRLNDLKDKMIIFSKKFEQMYSVKDLSKLEEKHVFNLFYGMQQGDLKTKAGVNYKSIDTFVKSFKAFWHWYMKVSKKGGKEIPDITFDLDTREDKPKWVYLTEEQVKKLCENAKFDYRVLITFLFDTGIRAPTELMNVKVSDLYNDCRELNISEEISKTFGRRIKLMLCPNLLKDYIEKKELKKEDYLFQIRPYVVNQYLRRISENLFGDKESPAGQKYSELTMYDFRHISCCYWLPRYKSESALKFRFGWKKSDKIHYYSEMLGMRDTIREDDLLIDITKTEIEKRLNKTENEKEMLQERVDHLEKQMKKILELTNKVESFRIINLRSD